MANYQTFTTITDFGPYISKLILELPCEVHEHSIGSDSFNIYLERKVRHTGEVILTSDSPFDKTAKYPSKGYQKAKQVYPCDAAGNHQSTGLYAAIELPEEKLGKKIEGSILTSTYVRHDYRITLLHELPADPAVSGLVFDTCTGDICPQDKGWKIKYETDDRRLNFAYFTPAASAELPPRLPLVIWLHGAGEGGQDPKTAYTGNKAVNLSSADIQRKLGGGAWVLVPQCPTVWMDDGIEQLGRSNRSIYSQPLKACIDEFIAAHEERIDSQRILIGGCSNGGFMTMRMIIDYPELFAAAFPVCEAFFEENITEEIVGNLKHIPIWFVHSKLDELVSPQETVLPMYKRLIAAGAPDVHFTYFNYMVDLSGMYRDELGRPLRYFNHAVWVHVYNDDCDRDLDGRYVLLEGEPVTLWEWLGKQRLEK